MQTTSITRRLLSDALRRSVEQRVSEYLGRVWRVASAQDKTDSASHPASILTDGTYAVFVKLGESASTRDEFEKELAGMRLLTERSGVLTPSPIGNLEVQGGAIMVLEAVQIVKRDLLHWRQMGQALAQAHKVKWDRCGLETYGYWGSLYQDNSPLADWPEFFQERRLGPRLKAAVDSGHLPLDLVPQIEKLSARLPRLCGPKIEPSLLHGDAHQSNFLSTHEGPVLIDPSVHYGHPEIDLAYLDFFTPVSPEIFEGYREIAPLDPGFVQRRELWRIPGYLAMIQVSGRQHLDKLIAAVRIYL